MFWDFRKFFVIMQNFWDWCESFFGGLNVFLQGYFFWGGGLSEVLQGRLKGFRAFRQFFLGLLKVFCGFPIFLGRAQCFWACECFFCAGGSFGACKKFLVDVVAAFLFCRTYGFAMGEVRRACSFAVPTTV